MIRTYSFIIHGNNNVVLAQSEFIYSTKEDAQKEILNA